jgi:hypothetical protein
MQELWPWGFENGEQNVSFHDTHIETVIKLIALLTQYYSYEKIFTYINDI